MDDIEICMETCQAKREWLHYLDCQSDGFSFFLDEKFYESLGKTYFVIRFDNGFDG